MYAHVKRFFLALTALATIAASATPAWAVPPPQITMSGSASVTGSLSAGTSAIFDMPGMLRITCARHAVAATTENLFSTNGTVATSVTLDSGSGNRYDGCTYTSLLGSGAAQITTTCGWVLAATSLTASALTIPANCTSISFSSGLLVGCTARVSPQTISAAIAHQTSPTRTIVSFTNAGLAWTGTGCFTSSGTINLTERLVVDTAEVDETPVLTATPNPIAFTTINQTIQITFRADEGPVTVAATGLKGRAGTTEQADFRITRNDCNGRRIARGGTCDVDVQWVRDEAGGSTTASLVMRAPDTALVAFVFMGH